MDTQFGQQVYEYAYKLQQQGKDANQIAKILCDQDSAGCNYGIGIILDGDGQPAATSPILLEYAAAELDRSQRGAYLSSTALLKELTRAVLQWQRIPETYWEQFILALPSDAGTGAVQTGVDLILALNPHLQTVALEELGWPAYKAIARLARIRWQELAAEDIASDEVSFPVYQAGPMNTTGLVQGQELIAARAQAAARRNTPVLLDRAYSGFEYARLLATQSYDEIMRLSYALQIAPFIECGVTFCLAISPTKSFVSFALRPCGLLLCFCPDASRAQEIDTALNLAIRARGSSFEHPTTRALITAMVKDRERLEADHQRALERVAEAEALWRKLVEGTSIAYLYSDRYAGLFRNPKAREGAPIAINNEHIYPVFAEQRCRQNVTGIPSDEELARKHVQVFADQCY
jgi:aspartate/tyrosine/aromatic aminotransferase